MKWLPFHSDFSANNPQIFNFVIQRLADYVLFIYLGELIEPGLAAEIFDNPKEDITKEYIKGIISEFSEHDGHSREQVMLKL